MTDPLAPPSAGRPPVTPDAPVPPAKPASLWEDFVDIYVSPVELFRRRVDGRFGLALLVLTLVVTALFFVSRDAMAPMFDAMFAKQADMMRERGMNEDQIAAASRMGRTFMSVGAIFSMPIIVCLVGVGVWLVGKFFGAASTFRQAMTIATFAEFPRIIQAILNTVQAAMLDASRLTSQHALEIGPGRFLDPASTPPWQMAIAGRFDLFVLWITVLIGIGVSVIGRVSRGKAAAVAVILWLLGALFMLRQG